MSDARDSRVHPPSPPHPNPSPQRGEGLQTPPGTTGRRYCRSLEELADTPRFREWLHREFPEQASEWTDGLSRRQFLTLMGASLALAGVAGCAPAPAGKIVPYVRQPEQLTPGKPLYFATAMTLG